VIDRVLPVARAIAVQAGTAILIEQEDGRWAVYQRSPAVIFPDYERALAFARELSWAADDERPTLPRLERPK
jgi:hypothetical protein